MELELVISAVASAIALCLYIVALWIGGQQTISNLATFSNAIMGLAMAVASLAYGLGLPLSLVVN